MSDSGLPLVLDLFSGTGSATQPFMECGKHRVVRVDIAGKPDVRADVRHLPFEPGVPVEFAWLSHPCEGLSVAGIPWHWKGHVPDATARRCLGLQRAAWDFIHDYAPARWVIENPVGLARRYRFAPTDTVFYCSYGARYKKPTDLWHNLRVSLARPCAPHESSPRGSKHGIQSFRSGDPRRAMVPRPLADAVHRAVCDP